jgi:acetolactate decarboxylase
LLDGELASANLFYAIRVDGRFRHVRTRSVPRQSKPYPPLTTVTEDQPCFDLQAVSGTLAGFRFPAFAEGMNVPGYHLHFLSEDRQAGGHVLALQLESGRLAIDDTSNFHIELPTDGSFLAAELGGDRAAEVRKVEK